MDSKLTLRAKAKEIRKNLDLEKISKEICKIIRKNNFYKESKNIMIFYPLKYEINLLDLLKDNKNFYLPKVNNEDILICPYDKNLVKSELNIYEPCTNPVDSNILDLIFVPALMVDKENYRLGYGGGFYDRFLKTAKAHTIVPIAKELIVEKLPHEKFDIKINETIFF